MKCWMLKEKKNNEAIYMGPRSEKQILLLALDCKGKCLPVSQTGSCLFYFENKEDEYFNIFSMLFINFFVL